MFTLKLFFWFLDMILLLAENSDTYSSDRDSNLISSASLYEHVFNLYNLSSSSNSTDLVNLTDSDVRRWYGDVGYCMLSSENESLEFSESLVKCKSNVTQDKQEGENTKEEDFLSQFPIFSPLTRRHFNPFVPLICCTVEMPTNSRGFLQVFRSFNKVDETPVLDALHLLAGLNQSILLIGDSITAQSYAALISEAIREVKFVRRTDFPRDVTNDMKLLLYGGEEVEDLYSVYRWRNLFLYNYKSFEFDFKNLTSFVLFEKQLLKIKDAHPSGLVVIVNVGHWLNHHKKYLFPEFTIDLVEKINDLLVWSLQFFNLSNSEDVPVPEQRYAGKNETIKDSKDPANLDCMGKRGCLERSEETTDPAVIPTHRKSLVIYRETTPAHFPTANGMFELLELAQVAGDTVNPVYPCQPLPKNYSNRIDNMVAREVIAAMGYKIPVISVVKYFAPFYNIHKGKCHEASNQRSEDLIDCLHFCSFAPPMWMPLWVQLLAAIRQHKHELMQHQHSDFATVRGDSGGVNEKDVDVSEGTPASSSDTEALNTQQRSIRPVGMLFNATHPAGDHKEIVEMS